MNSRAPVSRLWKALPFGERRNRWRGREHGRKKTKKRHKPGLNSVPFVPASPDWTVDDQPPSFQPDSPRPCTPPSVDCPLLPEFPRPMDFAADVFGAEMTGLGEFFGNATNELSRRPAQTMGGEPNLEWLQGLCASASGYAEPVPTLSTQEGAGRLCFEEKFALHKAPAETQGSASLIREKSGQQGQPVWERVNVDSAEAVRLRQINEAFGKLSGNVAHLKASHRHLTNAIVVHNSLSKCHMDCKFEIRQLKKNGYSVGMLSVVVYEKTTEGKRLKQNTKNRIELATVVVAEAEGMGQRKTKEKLCGELVNKLHSDQFAIVHSEGRWRLIAGDPCASRNVPESSSSSSACIPGRGEERFGTTDLLKLLDPCVEKVGKVCCVEDKHQNLDDRRERSALTYGQKSPIANSPSEKTAAPFDLRKKLEQMRSSQAVEIQAQLSSIRSSMDQAPMDLRRKLDQKRSSLSSSPEISREKMSRYSLGNSGETKPKTLASAVRETPSISAAAAASAEGGKTMSRFQTGQSSTFSSAMPGSMPLFRPPQIEPMNSRSHQPLKRPGKTETFAGQPKHSDGKRPFRGSFDAPVTKQMKLDLGQNPTRSQRSSEGVPQQKKTPADFKMLAAKLTEILAARKKRISEYDPRNVLLTACRSVNLQTHLSLQKKNFKWRTTVLIEADIVARRSGKTQKCAATKCCHAAIERIVSRHGKQNHTPTKLLQTSRNSARSLQHQAATTTTKQPPAAVVGNKLDAASCSSGQRRKRDSSRGNQSASSSGYESSVSGDKPPTFEETGARPRQNLDSDPCANTLRSGMQRIELQTVEDGGSTCSQNVEAASISSSLPSPQKRPFHVVMEKGSRLLYYLRSSANLNGVKMEVLKRAKGKGSTILMDGRFLASAYTGPRREMANMAASRALRVLQEHCWTVEILNQTLVLSREDVLTQEEETGPVIPEHNRGNVLLRKLGWSGGGIGKTESGIEIPVSVRQEVFRRQCLGTATASGMPVDFPGKFGKALEAFVACSHYYKMEIHSGFNAQEEMVLRELCRRYNLVLSFQAGPKAVVLHRREVRQARRLKNLRYEDVDSWIRSECPPPPGCRIIPPQSSQVEQVEKDIKPLPSLQNQPRLSCSNHLKSSLAQSTTGPDLKQTTDKFPQAKQDTSGNQSETKQAKSDAQVEPKQATSESQQEVRQAGSDSQIVVKQAVSRSPPEAQKTVSIRPAEAEQAMPNNPLAKQPPGLDGQVNRVKEVSDGQQVTKRSPSDNKFETQHGTFDSQSKCRQGTSVSCPSVKQEMSKSLLETKQEASDGQVEAKQKVTVSQDETKQALSNSQVESKPELPDGPLTSKKELPHNQQKPEQQVPDRQMQTKESVAQDQLQSKRPLPDRRQEPQNAMSNSQAGSAKPVSSSQVESKQTLSRTQPQPNHPVPKQAMQDVQMKPKQADSDESQDKNQGLCRPEEAYQNSAGHPDPLHVASITSMKSSRPPSQQDTSKVTVGSSSCQREPEAGHKSSAPGGAITKSGEKTCIGSTRTSKDSSKSTGSSSCRGRNGHICTRCVSPLEDHAYASAESEPAKTSDFQAKVAEAIDAFLQTSDSRHLMFFGQLTDDEMTILYEEAQKRGLLSQLGDPEQDLNWALTEAESIEIVHLECVNGSENSKT